MSVLGRDILVFDRQLIEERDYWVKKLSETEAGPAIRPDHHRRARAHYREYDAVAADLDGYLHSGIIELTNNGNFLLYVTLVAALKVCLHRYTLRRAVIIGSPCRRGEYDDERQENLLAISDEVADHLPFREFLLQVRETLLEAYARQRYPFSRLLQDLELEQAHNAFPLTNVIVSLKQIHADLPPVDNDITFHFSKEAGRIAGTATFDSNLFEPATIERLILHFKNVLATILENPNAPISRIEVLTKEERRQVVVTWNATEREYPADSCIHQLFEDSVKRMPEKMAVLFQDKHVTYSQLNRRANRFAHYLMGLGVGPEVLVGIRLERSVELIWVVIGILKAGGAYVPLDTAHPRERLAFMLNDARVAVFITQPELEFGIADYDGLTICLDHSRAIDCESDEDGAARATADNLAYVIYTSGSTGRPKGVLVQHGGLCNLAIAASRGHEVSRESHVLQFASSSFDSSVCEIFTALVSGATLHLGSPEELLPGPNLRDLLTRDSITVAAFPPTALRTLPDCELPALRTLITAGEACTPELVALWSEGRRFINAYGPTETTVCATLGLPPPVDDEPSIGTPLDNVKVYVVDGRFEPAPIGAPGELLVGGVGLARGYLGRPEITADRFVPDSFGPKPGSRLYRTGDIACYRANGEINFLGRSDRQVKVRGYRVEPQEVELALQQADPTAQAVVVARPGQAGEPELVAFVVPAAGAEFSPAGLRRALAAALPSYMLQIGRAHV